MTNTEQNVEESVAVVQKKDCEMTLSCTCLVSCVLSSLEDCLAAQSCTGVETLRKALEKTSAKLQCARACEVHLRAELACVKER